MAKIKTRDAVPKMVQTIVQRIKLVMSQSGRTCGQYLIVLAENVARSGVNRNKLIAAVGLTVVLIAMMTSNQLLIYASPTTEDDGYTYPDDASEEEKEEIDEREQEAWEEAGRPGERDDDNNEENDNNDDNDNNVIPRPNESPAIANTPGLELQSTAINETRWYNNCVGGGKQDGGGLQFNTFSYQTCGQNANGDKGYHDGFVQGCMGIDGVNT